MAYIYRNPLIVASPKGKVEVIKVLFDGKEDPGYSLAIVKWYGEIKLAIRWNIADSEWDDSKKQNGLLECIGSPQSRGHSTWFVLPDGLDFIDRINSGYKDLKDLITYK